MPFYISYSHRDSESALWLADSLNAAGIEVWIDRRSSKVGADWNEEAIEAMQKSDGAIIILSDSYIQSAYAMEELKRAVQFQKRILPIAIENWSWAVPPEIRRLSILKFYDRDWQEALLMLIGVIQEILQSELSSFTLTIPPPGRALSNKASPKAVPIQSSVGIRPIKIFVSSPGDLATERRIAQRVIRTMDRRHRFLEKYKLIDYLYEDSALAQAGQNAQIVVNETMIKSTEADIVICMVWSRMGTPTDDPDTHKSYQSGTEYEFLTAYENYKKTGKPIILLYECERPTKKSVDVAQLALVQAFFRRFDKAKGGDLEALVVRFKSASEFEQLLERQLEDTIDTYFK